MGLHARLKTTTAPQHRAVERLGLSVAQAKAWDIENRKIIAEELGHGRIGITNTYLG